MLNSPLAQRLLALTFCLAAGTPSGWDETDDYVFVPATDRWVEVFNDRTTSVGRLNATGKFLPFPNELNKPKGQPRSSIDRRIEILNWGPEKNVYEFRSGRLIKGELNVKGYFVPEIGAKVIDFKDYRYHKDAPRIWNLPGRFEKATMTSMK